jgi:hypothetical protein
LFTVFSLFAVPNYSILHEVAVYSIEVLVTMYNINTEGIVVEGVAGIFPATVHHF